MKYYGEIQTRIEQAQKENPKCKVRKDSVKFIDAIITASPEYFAALPPEKARRYFERALEFLQEEVGAKNIFSAVVHMDEHNPHMHLCFVPLTEDNRLSAKEVIGSRDKLVQWQDKFHDYMSEEFPELDRGQAAAVTRRKHVPTWMYKQAHRLTDEMEQIRSEIKNIDTLNAGKQREKVLKLLSKWYPQVNAFEAKLKPYDQEIQSLNQRVREEHGDAERTQVHLQYEREQSRALADELQDYRDFIDSIPQDVFDELKRRYEMQLQELEQGQKYS